MGRAARNNVEEIIRRSAASIANGAGFRKANSEALNLLSLVLAQCKLFSSFLPFSCAA